MNNRNQHYNITKEILLKKRNIRAEFKPFAEWFEKTYAVEIANITFELMTYPNRKEKTPIPSLGIVFKCTKDFSKFHNDNLLNSDNEIKQVIGKKFKSVLGEQGLSQEEVLNNAEKSKESTKNVEVFASVHFYNFEYLEKNHVKRNLPEAEINALLDRINNKEIYQVLNYYSGITIVLYTKAQVSKYRDTKEFEKWVDLFFELIKANNQLVFFKRESLRISLNSKERMDEASSSILSNYR